jgi:hypothetical protein
MNDFDLLQYMQKHFSYNYQDGNFYTVVPQANRNKIGDMVGRVQSNGYVRISIKRKFFQAHRLVWLWHNKIMPAIGIDHINNVKSDNRIQNLRLADQSLNARNVRKARSTSKTGTLGVVASGSKFAAVITHDGKTTWLGSYETIADASEAYWRAKATLHSGAII